MRIHRGIYWPILVLFLTAFVYSCDTKSDDTITIPDTNEPPGKPYAPYPPDGSADQSRSPILSWKCEDPEGDPVRFWVTLGKTGTAVKVFISRIPEGPTLTVAETLEANTEYEWFVSAADTIGDLSHHVTGDVWTFTTGDGFNNPPGKPYDMFPHSDLYRQNKVVFQWACSDPDGDELTYDLLLGSLLGTVTIQDLTETSYLYESLEMDVAYGWRVIAHDAKGASTESDPQYFTSVSSYPPNIPFAPFPADDATGVPVDVTLRWSCTDPDADPLVYDIRMGPAGGSLITLSSAQTDTFLTVPGLEYDTSYDWQIVAEDDYGLRTLSPFWTFTTEPLSAQAPGIPFGPFPADGATEQPVDVTLSWSCTDPNGDPLTYDVAMGPAGGTLLRISAGQTETSLAVTGLLYEQGYDWMVTARDDGGLTTSGPIWTFTTKNDPNQQDGVFAELTVQRNIGYDGSTVSRNDFAAARFDSAYAPDGPVTPLQPNAVSCNSYALVWQGDHYFYSDWQNPMFLNHNVYYEFNVTAGGGVPALSTSIQFPSCEMYITNPTPFASISRDGFDLSWQITTCSGTVDIILIDTYGNPPYFSTTTENDGSYTFTSGDLSAIPVYVYELQILLVMYNRELIDAAGYHPQSWIWARVQSVQTVTLF